MIYMLKTAVLICIVPHLSENPYDLEPAAYDLSWPVGVPCPPKTVSARLMGQPDRRSKYDLDHENGINTNCNRTPICATNNYEVVMEILQRQCPVLVQRRVNNYSPLANLWAMCFSICFKKPCAFLTSISVNVEYESLYLADRLNVYNTPNSNCICCNSLLTNFKRR